jgi:signal transduction histidine kinase
MKEQGGELPILRECVVINVTQEINLHIRDIERIQQVDLSKAIDVCEQALTLLPPDTPNVSALTHVLCQYARLLLRVARPAEALQAARRALEIARKARNLPQMIVCRETLAAIHLGLGDTALAMQHCLEGLRLLEQCEDRSSERELLARLARIHEELGEYEQAAQVFERVIAIDQQNGDPLGEASTCNYLANVLNKLGRYEAARTYAERSLSILDANGIHDYEPHSLYTLANTLIALNNDSLAEFMLVEALRISDEMSDTEYAGDCYLEIGRIQMRRGELQDALNSLTKALQIAQERAENHLISEIHRSLADLYKSTGDYRSALIHAECFHEIYESLYNSESDKRLRNLQISYQVEQAQLEAEVERQRRTLLQQEVELRDQIIQELDSYADNIAHDLKNPIHMIRTYAVFLQEDWAERMDDMGRMYIEDLSQIAGKMSDIVEGLLSLARVRRAELNPSQVSMERAFHDAYRRAQFMLEAEHGTIEVVSELPDALGVATWVEELWINYLTNAVKYGGRPPHIRVGAERLADGMVRYWVQDNGDGIAPEQQAKLFRKYERLGQTKLEGHGLGLAVVQQIIAKLGGSVQVESSGVPGEGSTFSFTLWGMK